MSENVEKKQEAEAPGIVEASSDDPKAVSINKNPAKLTKQQKKKLQQYLERRQRLINKGAPPDKVDQIIARQDFDALPLDKQFKRLEGIVTKFSKGIAEDINVIDTNEHILAETYDINLKAMEKIFIKLGVKKEEVDAALAEAKLEVQAENAAKSLAQEQKRTRRLQEMEKERENALLAAASEEHFEEEPAIPDAPEFGGTD